MRILLGMLLLAALCLGDDYQVGPGQPYESIGDVPWYKLGGGDTVYIHYRQAPYREKILISGRGSASAWLRIIGVPGPNGELPVISGDGAVTSTQMHWRWPDSSGGSAVQPSGILQIARHRGDSAPKPGYIEIANLQIQDGHSAYHFTAENGVTTRYQDFCACIYARSADHILIRDNVLRNCGLGFYNWIGSSAGELQSDTVLRGNHFLETGIPGQYFQHASYTESNGVTIEFNHYGPMRAGALGSQIKDRSAGTVIRYNYIESAEGWALDLVEPENGADALLKESSYQQTWVYGNLLIDTGRGGGNVVHWNGDRGGGNGRADLGGTLFFYDNTFVMRRDAPEIWKFGLFSVSTGGGACPRATPGVIDARNNIWANLPRTAGAQPAQMFLARCGIENFTLGRNWISPGWTTVFSGYGKPFTGTLAGASNLVAPRGNNPGFVSADDYRLSAGSSARGIGAELAAETTSNSLGADLTPTAQYLGSRQRGERARSGAGSDAGALETAPPADSDSTAAGRRALPPRTKPRPRG